MDLEVPCRERVCSAGAQWRREEHGAQNADRGEGTMTHRDRKNVILFVATVYLVTFTLNLFIYLQGGYASASARALVPLQMLIPAVVAVAFILKEKGRFREYGFRFGGLRYYLLAYLLMVGYHLLHSLLSRSLGFTEYVGLAEGFGRLAPDLQWPLWQIFIMLFVLGPVQNVIFGFGEEFGWRGFLLNKLLPGGLWYAILVSGVIWGLWHAPVVLMGHNFPENPYLGVIIMTIAVIPLGAIFTWLRLKSGSSVVVGFAHGVLNGTVFLGGAFIPAASMLWANPIGLLGIPLLCLIAWLLFRFFPVRLGGV